MSENEPAQQIYEQSGRLASLQIVDRPPGEECVGFVAWLDELVGELRPGCSSLVVRLVPDDEMRRLNRDFRGQDRATDVLSFPGDDSPAGRHLGDIVIALAVARCQADERRHSLGRELRLLALHGVLHCMGYDHEVDDGQMEDLESDLRQRWIGATPFAEGKVAG